MPGYFGINLNFYNRDADVSKIVVVTFDCKELVDPDDDEEVKEGEARMLKAAPKGGAGQKDLA